MQPAFDPAQFRRNVLLYIRRHRLLRSGDRVAVAVSGGADSVALLRFMLETRAELGAVLSVAHFNHKIRTGASDADEHFVRELSKKHGLELHLSSADVPAQAVTQRLSLETAARELRYGFFRELICSGTVSKVMTAHTLDDQAETVLMRIVRGTGTSGLAGIYPRLKLQGGDVIRPFLDTRRCEIESYLRALGQNWQEDATNRDIHHARNRVRHVLLPLLETEFNAGVRQRLAELADIARIEEEHWDELASQTGVRRDRTTLDAQALVGLPVSLQRRVIRNVAAELGIQFDFGTTDVIRRLASGESVFLELPDGWCVRAVIERRPSGGAAGTLIRFEHCTESERSANYEYTFQWPGHIRLPEAGVTISAVAENSARAAELLDPQKLEPTLTVRNWRPGDRFWPVHTSGPKKVKELLQKRHITGRERESWPVALSGSEIVWLRDFPVSEKHRATGGAGLFLEVQPIRALDE